MIFWVILGNSSSGGFQNELNYQIFHRTILIVHVTHIYLISPPPPFRGILMIPLLSGCNLRDPPPLG